MTSQTEQQFLEDLDKKLWNAADRLRSNIDAAEYKHVVLGLIFLKYVSDSFDERRAELEQQFKDPTHEYYLGDDPDLLHVELETRDFYLEKNVFWVPALARWKTIQDSATLPPGTKIEIKNGKTTEYEFRSINKLIDDALEAIEKENPKLKNVLDKRYAQRGVDATILIGIINDVVSKIPFKHESMHAKDILGHVYEYFLGQFALAEGKKGGQYYTPKSIVSLIVEMLQPFKGRVYDPAMGSGGFFVQSERFIEEHKGKLGNISVYGQESNPTTWRLAAMNMAIRGIDFNFGTGPANTYSNDQHPDLRADFVMANPPFNMKEWKSGVKDDDPRWAYGIPPDGNANFAWLQHMFYHLAPNGSLGLLLANGSMSSNTNNEGEIRKKLLTEDRIECMVALPGQLFTNTQIPACIWFLTKNKKARDAASGRKLRDRSGEVLFIDARNLGYMKDRVLRDFKPEDIKQIVSTFHNWQSPLPLKGEGEGEGEGYKNIPAFCYSAKLDEIAKHDYVLTPGRYVGAAEQEDDGEPFAEKMQRLTAQLKTQFDESTKLEEQIRKNLAGLGYEV
jgi:type I restriction enzyme M protein